MRKNLYIVLACIVCTAVAIGCQPKRGCTDAYSDNYDPEAKQDDDTCIPTREKFVGEYTANGTIEIGEDTLVPYEQIGLNIEDSTAQGPTQMIIGISNFDAQLYALRGTVRSTYKFSIDNQTIGDYTYWGDGNVNGRVLEIKMTRKEVITLPDETTINDTIRLNLYAIKDLE